MQRKTWTRVILGLILIAGAAGGWAYRHHQRYKHLAVHDQGMVYRSAWLEPDVFQEIIEKHQLRTIINLCEPGEMGEKRWEAQRQAVRGTGAQLVELSLPRTIDPHDPMLDQYVEILRNPDSYPLLVHCQHGVTRTAKILAMYDILFRGMTAEQSLNAMPLFGRDGHNVAIKAFAAEYEKEHRDEHAQLAQELSPLRR